jgi:hypothetical protein
MEEDQPPDLWKDAERIGQEMVPIVMQEDPLRILIQGHARIERHLNEAISAAFDGALPRELKWLPFRTRVALARALKILQEETASHVLTVASVRHDLVHGAELDLTTDHVNRLRQLVAPHEELSHHEPRGVLRIALGFTWGAVVGDVAGAEARRRATERALAGLETTKLSEALLRRLARKDQSEPTSDQ